MTLIAQCICCADPSLPQLTLGFAPEPQGGGENRYAQPVTEPPGTQQRDSGDNQYGAAGCGYRAPYVTIIPAASEVTPMAGPSVVARISKTVPDNNKEGS